MTEIRPSKESCLRKNKYSTYLLLFSFEHQRKARTLFLFDRSKLAGIQLLISGDQCIISKVIALHQRLSY